MFCTFVFTLIMAVPHFKSAMLDFNPPPPPFCRASLALSPQCYMFHMYVGVRAGGGIGDQIEDPAGDEYEIYRIIFDITFFFFVIVILLAIIQGELSHMQPLQP